MMPSITSLNFNDLPEDVHKAFFDNFNSVERTLVLPTCQKWHDLIISRKAWWREAIVGAGFSKEKMMRILQVFDQRSQGSLIKVQIDRKIETEEELQEVLSCIEPSIGSIKLLALRQVKDLNTQTRTFARRMPQLQHLRTRGIPMKSDYLVPGVGFKSLETDSLDDLLEQEEVEWLSQLKSLRIVYVSSERILWSILSSCKASLVTLRLGKLSIQEGHGFGLGEPIVMEVLADLAVLQTSNLPLVAPVLRILHCTLSQAEAMQTPSLRVMTLVLEDESGEDWEEDEEQGDQFIERFKTVFQQTPKLQILALEGTLSNLQLQSHHILQALLISDENAKEVVLPKLCKLQIRDFEEDVLDLKALASLAISRMKYLFDQHLLKLGHSKINMDILNEDARRSVGQLFKVDLDPVDPNLKDEMMEQYLKMKKSIRLYEDWIKELELRRFESTLNG